MLTAAIGSTRKTRVVGAALLAAAVVATLPSCTEEVIKDGGTYSMQIAGKPFNLKVSSSDPTRMRGLGGVDKIADDGGMIFIFPDSKERKFYMKDCVVDMDIMFLDSLGYVTATYTMPMQPARKPDETETAYDLRLPRYSSLTPAQYAIELRKGRIAELGIKTREKIPLDLAKLRPAAK